MVNYFKNGKCSSVARVHAKHAKVLGLIPSPAETQQQHRPNILVVAIVCGSSESAWDTPDPVSEIEPKQ